MHFDLVNMFMEEERERERERERGLMGNDGKMLSLTTLTTKTAVARC